MQLTFGAAGQQCRHKRIRREFFLSVMGQVVSWGALLALIEPHYPWASRPGR